MWRRHCSETGNLLDQLNLCVESVVSRYELFGDRMTAINLDDQIVATSYDKQTGVCTYTYEHHDGSRYTVQVHLDEFPKTGVGPMNKEARRRHIATKIMNHVQTNPPDKVT